MFGKNRSTGAAAVSNAIYTNADLKVLLIPLLMEQLLNVTVGMADTMMVSSVGEAAISGVSLVDNINTLIIQVISALATGGAVIASQYLGRGDMKNARRGSSQLYSVLTIVTLLISTAAIMGSHGILRTVFGSIDDNVMGFAQTYFLISAISYPFMGVYVSGAALFRAQGNSRISMYASFVMNVINISGNALLIYGFGMGVLGAAIATLVGRIFAAVFVTIRLQQSDNPMRINSARDFLPDPGYVKRILSLGIPAGLENGIFQIGKLMVSSLVSTLGTASIAANAVWCTVSSLATIPGNASSLAMIPVVGRCLGAGEKEQASSNARKLMLFAYGGLLLTNLFLVFTAEGIASLYSLSEEARSLMLQIARMFNVFGFLFWPSSFTMPNALRAGGDAKFTMTVSILSMWLCRVGLCYLFVLSFNLGLIGVWLSMFVDWVFRSAAFYLRFRSGRWMNHKVI